MPVTDAELRAEYEAGVERLAGRVLGALDGTGGTFGFSRPPGRAGLAAVRGLGPDPFAAGSSDAPSTTTESPRSWPRRPASSPPAAGGDNDLTARHDRVPVRLAGRGSLGVPVSAQDPACAPPLGDRRLRSPGSTRLAPLALPGLDGPVHAAVRAESPALAGGVRAVLRRDHRTAARLT